MPIKIETDEEYHGGDGVSKSTLWTLWNKTPFHARYGAKKESAAFEIGKATHIAILEPDTFEARVTKGPAARGNSNEWKHAQDFATAAGTILLKPDAYDQCLMIRDLSASVAELDVLRDGSQIVETSAYHVDEETGILTKCRPDIYNPTHRIMADVKNMADGSPWAFQRDVGKFGYHMQHATYADIWTKGAEMEVDAFFFIVFEKSEPPMVKCYELKPSAVAEGYATYRAALKRYAECMAADEWPGYGDGIERIGLRYYDYKLTQPPADEEAEPDDGDDEIEDLPE